MGRCAFVFASVDGGFSRMEGFQRNDLECLNILSLIWFGPIVIGARYPTAIMVVIEPPMIMFAEKHIIVSFIVDRNRLQRRKLGSATSELKRFKTVIARLAITMIIATR